MSNNEIDLNEKIISEQDHVKELISGVRKPAQRLLKENTLYSLVVDSLSNGTRNTVDQINYLEVFEKSVGVFRAAALELRKDMDVITLERRLDSQKGFVEARETQSKSASKATYELEKQTSDAILFSNRYALNFAGHVGLALLGTNKADIDKTFAFGTRYETSKERDALTSVLTTMTTEDLTRVITQQQNKGKEVTDDNLKNTLQAVFTSWVNQFSWESFEDIAAKNKVSDLKLRYGNFSITKDDFSRKFNQVVIDDKIMPITKEDVIGGEGTYLDGSPKLGSVIWENMKKLSAYDQEKQMNPHKPASTIFTFGGPGSGKTFISHGYLRSFADLCRQNNLPLWVMTHSITDYASHYQNQTSNKLAALGEQIKAFPGAVVMYVADADTIFQSRNDPNLSAEQKNTLGIYFKMFDGTMIPKNGKFMSIMDANYIEGIDDATQSRLFDEIVEMKRFDDPTDFAELARRTITKGSD